MNNRRLSRFFLAFTLLWCFCMFLTGCTTAWTTEANNIIQLLVPAITTALSILTAFGAGVTPSALSAVQSWSREATAGLQTVAELIQQYNTAEATAQPGILTEIQSALGAIAGNLATILPEIHVTDAATQAKIMAVIQSVQSELEALVSLVPALKGEVTAHDQVKALVAAVKTPKEFKEDFNSKASVFGDQYRI